MADAVVADKVKGARRSMVSAAMAQMPQKDREFQPGLLVIQTGTVTNFPNFDSVRHHAYSFSPIKTFEIKRRRWKTKRWSARSPNWPERQ